MPIISTYKSFIDLLETFTFPDPNPKLEDQTTLTNLIRLLKQAIQGKEDDLDITGDDLGSVYHACKACTDKKLAALIDETIKPSCAKVKDERHILLSPMLGFFYNFKMITDPQFFDTSKVSPEIISLCQRIFKTNDVIAYLQNNDFEQLIAMVHQSHLFIRELIFFSISSMQQKGERTFKHIFLGRAQVAPKRFTNAAEFAVTAEYGGTLTIKEKYGQFLPSSAPSSPKTPPEGTPRDVSSAPTTPPSRIQKVSSAGEVETGFRRIPKPKPPGVPPLPLRFSQSPFRGKSSDEDESQQLDELTRQLQQSNLNAPRDAGDGNKEKKGEMEGKKRAAKK
jgi:hypothetical protein